MNDNMISVFDAAQKLGMLKQTLFKVIKRLGIKTIKQRSSEHRGQAISYISLNDFELIIDNQETTCSTLETDNTANQSSKIDHGVFYLIQLEPEHDPGRFKLGFASNLPERLRTHHCSAPFAKVIKTWPCHVLWEKTAIDSVTQECKKIHTEVFRTKDIEAVKKRCDEFFELMPDLEKIIR